MTPDGTIRMSTAYLVKQRDLFQFALRWFSHEADYDIMPHEVLNDYHELPGFEEVDHDGGGIYFLWGQVDEDEDEEFESEYDSLTRLLYVGHAVNLRARWRKHWNDGNLEGIHTIAYAFGQDHYDMEVDYIRACKPTRNRKRHD